MPKILTQEGQDIMRRQIIQAAATEFARSGFEQTKIETIAEKACIGKGTIYLYFSSKQELFTAMLQEIALEQLMELQATLTDQTTLEASLQAFFSTFNRFIINQPDSVRIFISSMYGVNQQFQQEATKHRRPFLALIENILNKARQAGEIQSEPEPAALMILNMCQSLPLMAGSLGFGQRYIQEQQSHLIKMLIAGLQKDK